MTLRFLDIETYSRTDLRKANVYSYSEDPEFDVMMLAWADDDAPVQITTDPLEIYDLISDKDVTFVAHNAAFERVCFSRYLGMPVDEFLSPDRFVDTMALAAVNGYPRSLAHLATALGAEDKDQAGTRLINLFCKPDRYGRRITQYEKPKEWQKFLDYCVQDVETLRDVYHRLPGWPTEMEERVFHIDQVINDRGITTDVDMAYAAVEAGEENKTRDFAEMKALTGLANPNSTAQLLEWLNDHKVKAKDVRKETVQRVLSNPKLTEERYPNVRRVLELRQELALVASKKYATAIEWVSDDEHLRGSFNYHGAHTGRWCLTGDHEVLTKDGWVRLDEWKGGDIANWSPDHRVEFLPSTPVAFLYNGPMVEHESTTVRQISTPDHKMAVYSGRGKFSEALAGDLLGNRHHIPVTGVRNSPLTLPEYRTRITVMVQADADYTRDNIIRFRFKKRRKSDRCRELLTSAGITHSVREHGGGVTCITIPRRYQPKWLSDFAREKVFTPEIWGSDPDVFFEELELWDGYRSGPNTIEYSSTVRENADMVQALAHMSGRTARVKTLTRPGWNDSHVVSVCSVDRPTPRQKPEHTSIREFTGKVFCAETVTGFFLVRREGRVWVTGNSGRGVQLQNLPSAFLGSEDDAALAIDAMKMGLGADATTLKALVRQMFIGPFTVVDYSAIEARVIAWLAGEQWALEAFTDRRDIYVETAERMSTDQQTLTRKEGKVAVLALGYQGGLGALRAMGAEGEDEYLWGLVNQWREANPNIVHLWKTLDRAFQTGGPVGDHARIETSGRDRKLVLPSGRHLSYRGLSARREVTKWGKEVKRISFADPKKPGLRTDTYGGRLAENCIAGGAEVLTSRGWIPLEKVETNDLVYDGAEFVAHGGLLYKGVQDTISVSGVRMTEDHKILTTEGWVSASSGEGHYREEIRNPHRATVRRFGREKVAMGGALRLREGNHNTGGRVHQRKTEVLWVPHAVPHIEIQENPRDDRPQSLCGVAVNARQMPVTLPPGLGKLRGPGYNRLPGMDRVQEILGGHGAVLPGGVDTGSTGQLKRVHARKLPVGNPERAKPKQTIIPSDRNPVGRDNGSRSVGKIGGRGNDVALPSGQGGRGRPFILSAGRKESVYDLLNCGPRNRFVVRDNEGLPFIVHNCTQAVARDVLAEAIVRLEGRGYRVAGHVHDEVIVYGEHDPEEIGRIMCEPPSWATGLPVNAEGYVTQRYRKD